MWKTVDPLPIAPLGNTILLAHEPDTPVKQKKTLHNFFKEIGFLINDP